MSDNRVIQGCVILKAKIITCVSDGKRHPCFVYTEHKRVIHFSDNVLGKAEIFEVFLCHTEKKNIVALFHPRVNAFVLIYVKIF